MRRTIFFSILCIITTLVTSIFLIPSAQSATVSGQVIVPDSDMGDKPLVSGMKVRVEGTDLSADIVPLDSYTGNFTLADVPQGAVTLLLVENNQDVFTQSSKRTQVNVTGNTVSGASFNLVYHWKELAGYPSPMTTGTEGYGEWTAHFVSDQVGFLLFRVRGTGIPLERKELYRTVNGGQTWSEIGYWELDPTKWSVSNPLPVWWNSFYFSDQDHGVVLAGVPGIPCSAVGSGFFYTKDGGQHWAYTALPVPSNSYSVEILRFGQISPSHVIAAGSIGCGVQGYSAYYYAAIWESTDAGATWQLKWNSDPNPAGGFTALGVSSNGKAIAFISDGHYLLRDVSGAWTIYNTGILTNSGSGPAPADVPMVGDTAWVTNVYGALPLGMYQSKDAGLTWTDISGSIILDMVYMSFASEEKGFGLAVGPAYSSYDGGTTWLYQSAGGGISGHGNDIWAFDTTHAIWHEGGYSDPNGVAQIFSYVEPWETNFEIIPGISIKDGYIEGGDTEVPMASYELLNHGPVPIRVDSLTLHTSSPCTYSSDISQVKLWLDRNGNGYVDETDTLLAQGVYSADDETLPLSLGQGIVLTQLVPMYFLLTYDLTDDLYPLRTFTSNLVAQDVIAARTDTGASVLSTAPPNYPITGRRVTTSQAIFSDDFENGLGNWIVSSDNPPDPGYGWQIVDTNYVSPTHSAFVKEDRNNTNWFTNHYMILKQPLNLSQDGNYFLTFLHRYQLDPSFKLWVEASGNNGASWDLIGKYGSYDTWAAYSTGDFVYEVLDLSNYAGSKNLLIRFRFDSTAEYYYYGDWFLDDIKVFYSLIPKSVTLLLPHGGEIIPSGSTYLIEWEAPLKAETFKLMYSIDNGTTWKLIKDGVRGTSYCWQVPNTGGNKKGCLVKVVGYDSSKKNVGTDISNSPFTIEVVRVDSPKGGDILSSNIKYPITWTTNRTKNLVAKVKLYYTKDGGVTWTLITTFTGSNPGTFDWTPTVKKQRTQCKVRVVLIDASGNILAADASDNYFTIRP